MKNHESIMEAIRKQGYIPLFYHASLDESKQIVQALYDGGVRVIEYTNRGGNALYNFQQLVQLRNVQWRGLLLAAGTVKNTKDAKDYVKAGADFIVCPAMIKAVGKKLVGEEILWVPGCLTPTEILQASEIGAKLIKIFPGSILGSGYITALKDIFPDLQFMVTGGVDATKEDIESWFKAGTFAVGLGSRLISKDRIEKKEYHHLSEVARELSEKLKTIKLPA